MIKTNSYKLFAQATIVGATLLGSSLTPSLASAEEGHESNRAVIYFTRHAEKKTTQIELGDALTTVQDTDDEIPSNRGNNYDDVCGSSKCAEELNAEGLLRARLLADWFDNKGITEHVTHVYSSHKERTRQTVELIAMRAGLNNDDDLFDDGVQQLPADKTELNPQSTSSSEQPTINAILNLQPGDVAVIAGHSGTLYDIMEGIGINTDDTSDFPRRSDGKVRDFGDLWKAVLRNGTVTFKWRKNLQPTRLRPVETEPGVPVDQID